MAGRKEFELLFKLKATLGGNFNRSFTNAMNTTRQLQNTLQRINATQGKIDGYRRQAQAITENRSRLAELTAEHDRLQQEMEQTENPSESLRRRFERNAGQIERINARIEQQEANLSELGEELRNAGVDTERLTEENERLADSYEHIRQSQERLAKIADAQKRNDEAVAKTKAQLGGTIGAITAVGAAIYAGPVQDSIEFETAMAKVGTIADANIVPLSDMQNKIISLSNALGVNASTVAEDVYNAISAGQKTADAVSFVEKATMLAKGGFAETGQALDVLTTILNAYDMESSKTEEISNMLITTQNRGKVTVAELSSVMGKVIPTANANNVALEQLCAGYSIMTARGIPAAETTTYMNSMMNELAKSGTSADKALRQAAGKGFSELMAEGKSLADVLDILQSEAGKSGKTITDMFGSAEAGKAALALLANGVEGFNNEVYTMVDSAGAAQSAFKKMGDTTQNKIDKAKTALKNLSIVFGNIFLPYVTTGAEKLSELVIKFSDWAMENPELLKTIVKVVAGLAAFRAGSLAAKLGFLQLKGGVLGAMAAFEKFKLLGGIKGVLGEMGGAKGLLFGIGGKLLPVIAIATAIAVAIKLISGNLEEVRGFIDSTFGTTGLAIFNEIVSVVQNIGTALNGIFGGKNIGGAKNFFQNTFGDAGVVVFDAVIGVIAQLKAVLPELIDQLSQGLVVILPVIAGLFNQLLPILINIVSTALLVAVQAIGQLLPSMMEIITAVLPILIQLLQALAPVIQFVAELFGNVLGTALQSVSAIVASVMQIFQGLLNFITGVFTGNWTKAWEGVRSIFAGIIGSLGGIFKAPINTIIRGINTFLGSLNKLKMPEWVPGIGGKGFKIPLFPMLARGSENAPDTFIAGEAGAELITGAKGRKVFTAAQTGEIFKNLEIVKTIIAGEAGAELTAGAKGRKAFTTVQIGEIFKNFETVKTIQTQQVKIPKWVPGIGGKGFEIPRIPMFARGSDNTPDTFIAGEAGAELITGAKGRKVFTAAQTSEILKNMETVKTIQAQQVKMPKWVPGIGGKNFKIPLFPMLAKGSENAPDTFIAGEDGAELITGAKGRKIFTAAQTGEIFKNIGAAGNAKAQQVMVHLSSALQTMQTIFAPTSALVAAGSAAMPVQQIYSTRTAPGVTAPTVTAEAGTRTTTLTLQSNPVFNVSGGNPEELRAMYEEYQQDTLNKVDEMLRKKEDDERRGLYD